MGRLLGRLLAVTALAVPATALLAVAPAAAVQTSTFGISAGPARGGGSHLRASGRPGSPVDEQILVWNRTSRPLTLSLSVAPAHLIQGDVPALGGEEAPTRWVHLGQDVVTLGPHVAQEVGVSVVLPRILPHLPATAAILARPVATSAAAVSVVVQLGVLVTMSAAAHAPRRAPLGLLGWTAAGMLAAAVLSLAAARLHAVRLLPRRVGRPRLAT